MLAENTRFSPFPGRRYEQRMDLVEPGCEPPPSPLTTIVFDDNREANNLSRLPTMGRDHSRIMRLNAGVDKYYGPPIVGLDLGTWAEVGLAQEPYPGSVHGERSGCIDNAVTHVFS